jgi:hypothetical protein
MKPREYCCCAIPIVNAGIYAALIEQFVLGIVAGTLSIAAPSIVGAATPGAAKWIFAVVCYVGAGIQVLGFIAVSTEKSLLFKRYLSLDWFITIAGFSISAAWIIISATRHSTAQTNCQTDFYSATSTVNTAASLASASDTVCNIFSWVDVGIMGGLFVVLVLMQLYMLIVASSYSKAQQAERTRYNSFYESANPLTSNIPMEPRSDPHNRHRKKDSELSNRSTDELYPQQPQHAHTYEPMPTPGLDQYHEDGYGMTQMPPRAQPHSGES